MIHEQTNVCEGDWKRVISKDSLIAVLFPPLVIFLLFQRIHYGIDFTDESFYVALAYRFAMGDQPFVDEYNLAQVSGVLLSPFVSVFLHLNNSQPDGVVLFVRFLHLVFSALVAVTVFLALRRQQLAWQVALLAALMAIVFTPLALHSISYITLGGGFFTAGCFLALWSVRNSTDSRLSLMSGVAHGLAVICYPTLIIPSLFSLALTIWPKNGTRVHYALYFCIGGVLIGVLPAVLLFRAGYQNIETGIAYVLSIGAQGGDLQKLVNGSRMIWDNFPHKVAVAVGLTGIFILREKDTDWANRLLFVSVSIIPLALVTSTNLWIPNALPLESLYLVINFGLIAPVFVYLLWNWEVTRDLFRLVWIPSFIAGLVVSWSSGNGVRMGAIGMLPAAIVSLLLLASLLTWRNADASQNRRSDTIRGSVVIALVLCVFLVNQFVGIYRDDPLENLTVDIREGPYKGIFTTKERDMFLTALSSDISTIAKQNDKILFFDDFPAGYLMSNLRPATPTVWLNPTSAYPTVDRTINEKYYARRGIQPDLVVMLKKIPRPDDPGLHYPADDPLIKYVNSRYTRAVVRRDYDIYKR